MKKALIIVAHGSRMEVANSETIAFFKALGTKLTIYCEIVPAFLEFTKPDLKATIESLTDKGIKEIVVFPFFLSGGSHLRDIEYCISEAQKNHRGVDFFIASRLGVLNELEDFIAKYLNELS